MNDEHSERHPLDQLGEEFVARYRRGERPSVSEFAQKYPQWADQISELLQALVLMEQLGPGPDGPGESAAGPDGGGDPVPRQLGEYRILRQVGHGGMGVVYEAEQESLGRHVALKVLPFHALMDPTHLERFRREARAAARLHHTNIVPVFGVGEQDSVHYYAMQFIQGQGLDEVLQEVKRLRRAKAAPGAEPPATPGDPAVPGRSALTGSLAQSLLRSPLQPPAAPAASLPPPGVPETPAPSSAVLPGQAELSTVSEAHQHYFRSVARVGVQVADALAYAHGQGIVHRDIKPSNLLLDTQGTVWVTDFGLAKAEGMDELTQQGDVVGTLRYMAPERFSGRADPRADLYSLGLTLYEMLTLRPAFEETDRSRLIRQVTQAEPPPPRKLDRRIPRDLETIVLKASAKEPARRYASAAALADDLKRFLGDRPIEARRTMVWEQAWRWCRRNPAVAAVSALALVCLVAGLAAVFWQWRRAERLRLQAEANFRKAREAVDECFTTVTDNPAFLEPGMQPAREVLFRTTLKYYQEFLEQRRDDAAVRAELARSYARVGYLIGQIGAPAEAAAAYEQACALYEQLAQASGEVPFRCELARGYQRLGHLYRTLGRPDRAEAVLQRSLDLCGRLVDEYPEAHAYRNDLAQAHHGLGLLYRGTGRPDRAETAFDRAIALRGALARAHPTVAAYQTALATDYRSLSAVYEKASRPDEAEAALRKGLAYQEQVAQLHPTVAEYTDGLAEIYNSLGSFCLMNRRDGAEEAYRRALPLRQQLTREHPKVQPYQSALAKVQNNLALVYTLGDRLTEAEAMYLQALAVRQQLARKHPDVAGYQKALAKTHHDLGLLYNRALQPGKAEAAFRQALAVQEHLVRAHGANHDFAADLGCTLLNLGESALRRGDVQAGLDCSARAVGTVEAILRSEPRQADALRLLRQSRALRARLLTLQGRHADALAQWDRALDEDNGLYRLGRAAALAGLGDYPRATAEADALAAQHPQDGRFPYAAACVYAAAVAAVRADTRLPPAERQQHSERLVDRAVALLTQAQAAGYLTKPVNRQSLKTDKELDPLRDQTSFQKWLRQVTESQPERKAVMPAAAEASAGAGK